MNELLAKVADFYLPSLLLVTLGVGTLEIMRGYRWFWVKLFASAILVFSVMLLDYYVRIWALLGLDYSTHTALALALVIFIGTGLQSRMGWGFLLASFLAFLQLMSHLVYHSWADMGSTVGVIGAGLLLIYRLLPGRTQTHT